MDSNQPSPFLDSGPYSSENILGIIHLKRDLLVPTVLQSPNDVASDYAEGKVTNTRFGSFPHTTLLNVPWGSQIRASKVDTGSRGNKEKQNKKRKRETDSNGDEVKAAVTASTGFAHLLAPTPESWTLSLPHRTQVVYTPDYSYVLQRMRVRPGDTLIEAGAGSGSFSHAAARAVFNGYPWEAAQHEAPAKGKKRRLGKVYSYEYHEPRATKLREEIKEHRLDSVVRVTHRDVYQDGFCLSTEDSDFEPKADAIFLDLPAPWMALKHLTRNLRTSPTTSDSPIPVPEALEQAPFRSPLNPRTTTRICTFSPCIEQVTKTVSSLREYGWTEIDMVELSQKRLEVRRERIGYGDEGPRGNNTAPANVTEAVSRLRELEARHKAHRDAAKSEGTNMPKKAKKEPKDEEEDVRDKKLWKEGRVVHRTETDLKTHTSYLVFAVLPREWTEEDEEKCRAKWPVNSQALEGVGEGKQPKLKKVKT